jgi:hypothetical protein
MEGEKRDGDVSEEFVEGRLCDVEIFVFVLLEIVVLTTCRNGEGLAPTRRERYDLLRMLGHGSVIFRVYRGVLTYFHSMVCSLEGQMPPSHCSATIPQYNSHFCTRWSNTCPLCH